MIQGVEVVGLYVRDQDEALAFYVEKLGFRVHTDVRNGDYRWLTVQHPDQPSFQLGLFTPGPPVHDAATAQTLRAVVAKGAMPPLVLVVPPLIWGWLAYRMMSYDVLAEHASRDERRELIRRHRGPLFGMGVVTGYLGAAPSLVWVSGTMAVVLAPLLVPLAIWIYMLVFAFSALWFAHYALAALQALRAETASLREPASEPLPLVQRELEAVPPPALPPV